MNRPLNEILRELNHEENPLLAEAINGWTAGRITRQELSDAIQSASLQCSHHNPAYDRALALLAHEPDGCHYGKLVRDRIPEIIRRQGENPITRRLSDDEYVSELYRKLREETEEFLSDETAEEIADILEVIRAICAVKGFSMEEILRIRDAKRIERGGFEDRIYLIRKN